MTLCTRFLYARKAIHRQHSNLHDTASHSRNHSEFRRAEGRSRSGAASLYLAVLTVGGYRITTQGRAQEQHLGKMGAQYNAAARRPTKKLKQCGCGEGRINCGPGWSLGRGSCLRATNASQGMKHIIEQRRSERVTGWLLVPLHSDFDWLNVESKGQISSGRCLGSTSTSMLRGILGCLLMNPARSSVSTIW